MPLNLADMNKTYTILRITGNDQIVRHIAELGFIPGEEITVLSMVNGDFVVAVKDSRVAIGRELAKKIIIS